MLHPCGAGFFLAEPGGNLSGALEKRVAGHLLHTVGYALLRAFMSTIIVLPSGTLHSVGGCLHIGLDRIEGNSDLSKLLGRGVEKRIIVFGEWKEGFSLGTADVVIAAEHYLLAPDFRTETPVSHERL
jgi:hypothetical protein